jgi:hypothetical protein
MLVRDWLALAVVALGIVSFLRPDTIAFEVVLRVPLPPRGLPQPVALPRISFSEPLEV